MESYIPLHGRTKLGDLFDEDLTELNFLNSKPTCFVIFGKPGCGKTSIAKRLSEVWRCELVHGTDIVQREIDIGSTVGNKMQEMLMKGEALPSDFVIQLLKEKLSSPEVAHYGYVLDGLPSLSDEENTVQNQLDIIKQCQLKPDFIINIRIPDVDLLWRKNGMRVDSLTGDTYLKSIWDPPKEVPIVKVEEGGEEEGMEEMEEEEEITEEKVFELTKETKERLVVIPEHQTLQIEELNQIYKDLALKQVEDYMMDHDRQYLIELDGNLPLATIFEQLIIKLDTYSVRRTVVPIRLQSNEEEELPDEIDTDELLRTLASYQMPAPRHRWRRCRWGRWCPVALKRGNMVQGKPNLAVGFLDKIYVLSSPEAMTEFLRNPRPFLLPPMPGSPCKLAVFGPPLSGKSTVCQMLAEKYKAKVFNMQEVMKKKFAEAKRDAIEKARQEATEQAISMVQNKLEHEALERAEKRRKEMEDAKPAPEETEEKEEKEEKDEDAPDDVTESMPVDTESVMESETSSVPTVTAEHEEVQRMVEEAVQKAEKLEIKLPPEDFIVVLQDTMAKMVEERLKEDKDAPKDGGWILDAFPEDKDQWSAMVEASILPDECIVLSDKSPNLSVIRKRYFDANEFEITSQYRKRLIAEKQTALKEVEEDIRLLTQKTEESSEETETTDETDKDAKSEVVSEASQPASTKGKEEAIKRAKLIEEIGQLQTSDIGVPPHDSPEFSKFREICRDYDKEWINLQGIISGTGGNKPIDSDISDSPEEITERVATKVEGSFGYQAWSFTGVDLDEEEEDGGAGAEEEEEGEEDKNKKKQFGHSKHFDPVALKNDFVLWPGNFEIAAKYRERVYFFKSTENRSEFLDNPTNYLPKQEPLKPSPPRILILGARGSGKSFQGRMLAKEMGIFHVSFRERLQEIILPKTKRKMGPEHEEKKLLDKEMSVTVEEAVKRAIENPDEVAPADATEEEKFDLNDVEEAIRANLVDDEPLPVEVLEAIVPELWRKEPYRSTGFILEGFPRTADESQFLLQSGLFPDAAVLLMVDDSDVIKRLLPPRMKMWKQRKEMKDTKKQKIKEKKQEIRNEKIAARRQELLNEQKEKRAAQQEEEEEEEEDDIEETLMAEFEEEEQEEEEEELEMDASDRMKAEFGERFDDDVNKLQTVQEQLEEGSVPRMEVQASRKWQIVKYLLDQKIKPLVHYRQSMFERVCPVSEVVASNLLLTGFKHPSSFGKWDPVKLYSGDVIQPMQSTPTFPLVYNQYLYYLSSIETRKRFMENPIEYVFNQPVAKPVVPFQIAVIGPPKSGKTTICERFTDEFGTVRVSVGESVRTVLENQPESQLAQQIKSFLHQGELLPDELAVDALAIRLMDTVCTTRGYTLDGFPCTEAQMHLLSKRGVLPVKFIELDIDANETLHRAIADESAELSEQPPHSSDKVLMVKSASYSQNIEALRNCYTTQHQNWVSLEAKISKWKLWKMIAEIAEASVKRVQAYLDRIARGEAASLAELCISPSEFESHVGVYGHYCPVSLNRRGELVDCSDPKYLKFAVEFRSKYYKTSCREDMEAFLASPEIFVPPDAQVPLPPDHLLPKRRTREEVKLLFPMQVELNGYCPVAFKDGKLRFEALVEGTPDLAVEYKGRLHLLSSPENLDKFMRLPETYNDLKLSHKLPPKRVSTQLSGLPMLGYMEQGSSTAIIRALTAVGCFKPKFPFTSVASSSLFYVACHLKGFNPRNSEYVRSKYQKKLKEFEETCNVITYLGNNMTSRLPRSKPVDFEQKMNVFLGLENSKPSRNIVL